MRKNFPALILLIIPLVFWRASFSVLPWIYPLFSLVFLGLIGFSLWWPPIRIVRDMALLMTTLGLLLTLFLGMQLTPSSAFTVWKNYWAVQPLGGMMGHMVMLFLYGFTLPMVVASLYTQRPFLLFWLSMGFCGLTLFVLTDSWYWMALIGFLPLYLVWDLRKKLQNRGKKTLAVSISFPFLVVLLLSLPFALGQPRHQDLLPEFTLPHLDEAVMNFWPDFPFLQEQPGFGYHMNTEVSSRRPFVTNQSFFHIQGEPGRKVYLRMQSFDLYIDSQWERSYIPENQPVPPLATGEPTLVLRVKSDFNGLLPQTYKEVPPPVDRSISGDPATGFQVAPPFVRGEEIFLYPGRFPLGSPQKRHREYPRSLDLPQLPLAESMTDREKADEIRDYLKGQYAYSLSMDSNGYQDIIHSFLEQQQGFCIHFATTFVLMARQAGLSSRYVTGFLVTIPPEGEGEVTGKNAHAWPEVWIEGAGWLPWEPTPAEAFPQQPTEGEESAVSPQEREVRGKLFWIKVLMVGVVLFCLVYILTLKAFTLRQRLGDLVSKTERRGISSPEETGWTQWGRAVAAQFPLKRAHPLRLAKIWQGHVYGDQELTSRDRFCILGIVKYIKKHI